MIERHQRVVELAIAAGAGRRMRVDTTVVETRIHYPTDSSLRTGGIHVVARTLKRVEAVIGRGRRAVRNRLRSAQRRGFEIKAFARSPKTREGLVRSYRRLLATTRAVLRDADTMTRRVGQRLRTVDDRTRRRLRRLQAHVQSVRPLLRRVIAQTRARVLPGDTQVPDKVMSLFEPHAEGIRKARSSSRRNSGSSSRPKRPNTRSSPPTPCTGSVPRIRRCGPQPSMLTSRRWAGARLGDG